MSKKNDSSIIAIITMIFLFGMISFVTNLAAPIGNIWKMQPGIEGSNTWGAMGTMMNFLAYAVMGIPAGALLKKKGYKFTALAAGKKEAKKTTRRSRAKKAEAPVEAPAAEAAPAAETPAAE